MEGILTIVIFGWFVNLACLIIGVTWMSMMILSQNNISEAIIRLGKLEDKENKKQYELLIPFSGLLILFLLLWFWFRYNKNQSRDFIDFLGWYKEKRK